MPHTPGCAPLDIGGLQDVIIRTDANPLAAEAIRLAWGGRVREQGNLLTFGTMNPADMRRFLTFIRSEERLASVLAPHTQATVRALEPGVDYATVFGGRLLEPEAQSWLGLARDGHRLTVGNQAAPAAAPAADGGGEPDAPSSPRMR